MAVNAKNTILIGYFVHAVQSLKYRSAGERDEIICVRRLKLVIHITCRMVNHASNRKGSILGACNGAMKSENISIVAMSEKFIASGILPKPGQIF